MEWFKEIQLYDLDGQLIQKATESEYDFCCQLLSEAMAFVVPQTYTLEKFTHVLKQIYDTLDKDQSPLFQIQPLPRSTQYYYDKGVFVPLGSLTKLYAEQKASIRRKENLISKVQEQCQNLERLTTKKFN